MKKLFIIGLSISVILNGFFIYVRIRQTIYGSMTTGEAFPAFELYNLDVNREKSKFLTRLTTSSPKVLEKKYLFLNLWARNEECMDQIPILDTIIRGFQDNITFVCVSNDKTSLSGVSLREKHIHTKNFLYINESDTFMHAIWRETGRNLMPFGGLLPMNVIMRTDGKVIYIDSLQAFSGFKMDTAVDRKHTEILKSILKRLK